MSETSGGRDGRLGLRGKPAGAAGRAGIMRRNSLAGRGSWDYGGERVGPARQVGIIVKKQQDWQGGYRIRGAGAAGRIEAETAGLAQRPDGLGVK